MTQETPSAGDSAPETITLVDPVTGEQTTAEIDEPDHGIITMDLGGFAENPELYQPSHKVTMWLADGTEISIEDSAGSKSLVTVIVGDYKVWFDLTANESERFRSALMNTQDAAADKRRRG
jgi:hypothetical protein